MLLDMDRSQDRGLWHDQCWGRGRMSHPAGPQSRMGDEAWPGPLAEDASTHLRERCLRQPFAPDPWTSRGQLAEGEGTDGGGVPKNLRPVACVGRTRDHVPQFFSQYFSTDTEPLTKLIFVFRSSRIRFQATVATERMF